MIKDSIEKVLRDEFQMGDEDTEKIANKIVVAIAPGVEENMRHAAATAVKVFWSEVVSAVGVEVGQL